MARQDIEAWIPEEEGSDVLERVMQTSVIERLARLETMTSATKTVPRSGGMDVEVVGKGQPYGEDESANDEIILKARKFAKALRLAEEDLDDTAVAVIASKQRDWATSYSKSYDNACLATTGAENGVTVPFTSVYRALATADPTTGYTAGTNIVATAGALTFDHASAVLRLVEDSDYFDPADMVAIASPSLKHHLRTLRDANGTPILVQGQSGDSGTPDQLFEFPLAWSLGAKTSEARTSTPTGNPLLVIVNRRFLIKGVRSGPEFIFIDGRSGASALTDEALLKARARRGFVLGHPNAAAVLEISPVAGP